MAAFDKMGAIFSQQSDFVRTAIPHPEAEVIWMHYPIIINQGSPFSRKDFQIYFELRGIQTRPPFSGNVLNQPMMDNQTYIANDSYDNANDLMKNGILLGTHQGLTKEQFNHIENTANNFFKQYR